MRFAPLHALKVGSAGKSDEIDERMKITRHVVRLNNYVSMAKTNAVLQQPLGPLPPHL